MVEKHDRKKSVSTYDSRCIAKINAIHGEYISIRLLADILHIEPSSVRWFLIRHGIPKLTDPNDSRRRLVRKADIIKTLEER